jgi:hypothetical protein
MISRPRNLGRGPVNTSRNLVATRATADQIRNRAASPKYKSSFLGCLCVVAHSTLLRQAPTTPRSERRPSRVPRGTHPPDQPCCLLISTSLSSCHQMDKSGELARSFPFVRNVYCGPRLVRFTVPIILVIE